MVYINMLSLMGSPSKIKDREIFKRKDKARYLITWRCLSSFLLTICVKLTELCDLSQLVKFVWISGSSYSWSYFYPLDFWFTWADILFKIQQHLNWIKTVLICNKKNFWIIYHFYLESIHQHTIIRYSI